MSADVDIKISAKNQAKASLDQLRKDFRDLQKAQREATDPAQARAFEKALSAVDSRIKDAQGALRKANLELDKAEAKSKGLGRVWQGAGKFLTEDAQKIRMAGLAAAAAAALFAKSSLSHFSQVEDASDALTATFGSTGDAMIAWAKRNGDAYNLAQEEALGALQTYAGFAKSAGLHGQQLAQFSEDLVARSADLASYYGGSTADAIAAMGAALRGESEPARRYQVFVDDMALKNEYLALTGQKVTGTLTAQQKVLAAHSLILKQTDVAMGDVQRTQDSTANAMKDASQQWADLQVSVGEVVSEVAGPALRVLSAFLRVLAALPAPVKAIALGLGALGIAAMIALPRLLTIRAALIQIKAAGGKGMWATMVGGIRSVGLAGGVAGAAVAALAIGLGAYMNAQANATAAAEEYRDTLDEINGLATQASYQMVAGKIAADLDRPGDLDRLQKVGITLKELTAAAVEGGPALEAVNAKFDALRRRWGYIDPKTRAAITGAQSSLQNQTESVYDGANAWRVQQAAAEAAGDAVNAAATAHNAAATAADRQAFAEKALAGALTAADRILARRDAKRSLADATAAFAKKPSAETGDAVNKAILAVANTYAKPAKRAQFLKTAYEDFDDTVQKSNVDTAVKSKITAPLDGAYQAALRLLGVFRDINTAKPIAGLVGKRTSELGFADGGRVWGPGTGTSDSIPARLSRGEFVIRAAAAKAIGYEKLTVLNHADRIPTALSPISHSADPVIVQPHLTANVTATGQIDYEQALRRESRRVMRDSRTRLARAGR